MFEAKIPSPQPSPRLGGERESGGGLSCVPKGRVLAFHRTMFDFISNPCEQAKGKTISMPAIAAAPGARCHR